MMWGNPGRASQSRIKDSTVTVYSQREVQRHVDFDDSVVGTSSANQLGSSRRYL